MVRIRLTRLGTNKRPFYRVIATDSRSPRDGRFLEQLGYYDPMKTPKEIKLDLERVKHWIGLGAQPSDTVKSLIRKAEQQPAAPATP